MAILSDQEFDEAWRKALPFLKPLCMIWKESDDPVRSTASVLTSLKIWLGLDSVMGMHLDPSKPLEPEVLYHIAASNRFRLMHEQAV